MPPGAKVRRHQAAIQLHTLLRLRGGFPTVVIVTSSQVHDVNLLDEWGFEPGAQLYRARWQIELFFKWIKQHLRIKAFYGTSENAVKTPIWIAIAVYGLVGDPQKAVASSPLAESLNLQNQLCS